MLLDDEKMKRIEQLKHNEELLFKTIDYLHNMLIKNNIGYFDELDIYKKYLGFNEEDLEYLCIRDLDLEKELENEN